MAKNALGKGLGALLVTSQQEYDGSFNAERQQGPVDILTDSVFPNPNQPRKNFDEVALNELVNSIRIHGVISPIIVVKSEYDRYMIIAGERRWRAAKRVGLRSVPAIVRDYSDKQIKEISLIDNLQREDLNPIETARAVKELMDEFRYTQEQVAERIGKSRPAVANSLRLLTLSEPVMELVASGALSAGHAKCLVTVEDQAEQLGLARKGCDDRMSVRDFEKLIKKHQQPKVASQKPTQSIELRDLVERMQHIFATKVSAIGSDRKGRIYIDYFTRDDLDRLSELLDKLKETSPRV